MHFEIPHKMSYPYNEICASYLLMDIKQLLDLKRSPDRSSWSSLMDAVDPHATRHNTIRLQRHHEQKTTHREQKTVSQNIQLKIYVNGQIYIKPTHYTLYISSAIAECLLYKTAGYSLLIIQ